MSQASNTPATTLEREVWKTIPGWDGFYEASSLGRVRSIPRVVDNGRGGVSKRKGVILRPGPGSGGHTFVILHRDGSQNNRLVHRLVLRAFVGPCPGGMECRHLNGRPAENWVGNLAWGTKEQNIEDAHRHGAYVKGEQAPNAKLTNEDVLDIRARLARGERVTYLAREYGMAHSRISEIGSRKIWKHI